MNASERSHREAPGETIGSDISTLLTIQKLAGVLGKITKYWQQTTHTDELRAGLKEFADYLDVAVSETLDETMTALERMEDSALGPVGTAGAESEMWAGR